jgi:hypothetical protein
MQPKEVDHDLQTLQLLSFLGLQGVDVSHQWHCFF